MLLPELLAMEIPSRTCPSKVQSFTVISWEPIRLIALVPYSFVPPLVTFSEEPLKYEFEMVQNAAPLP